MVTSEGRGEACAGVGAGGVAGKRLTEIVEKRVSGRNFFTKNLKTEDFE